ncbi:MAG: US12 family protein [Thermoguttaceae bacterium]|nr:US12 family protein [Thermoguttaceae bacterium]MBR4103015.1 US12 family protein [Thermoguttaceae bacterium]
MNERNQLLFCADERNAVANQNSEIRKRFLTRTYLALCAAVAAFVALCLGLTELCGDVAVSFSREHPWSWLGVAFALIIATYVARYQALIRLGGGRRGQLAMLAINVVGSALFYLPYFAYAWSEHRDVMFWALGATASLFAALTAAVFVTRIDFRPLGAWCVLALIAIMLGAVVAALTCAYVPTLLCGVAILIASGFILADTSTALHNCDRDMELTAADLLFSDCVWLYFNILHWAEGWTE